MTTERIKEDIFQEVNDIIDWLTSGQAFNFLEFEQELVSKVFVLGRLFIRLFLSMREEGIRGRHKKPDGYKWQKPQERLLGTFFGKVSYWRSYVYQAKGGGGYYPLDVELGLTGDRFSMLVQSYAALMATKMSYAQVTTVLSLFLHWSPAQKSIEEMVLGLGRHTGEWFESAPAPEDEGEVLVIQFDSKGNPMATEEELEKRRGKRQPNPHPGSQRHRGKQARQRRGNKKRRKKGDKSKNAKMATIMVMYTLRKSADGNLEGPFNKKVYASHAPKRHVVAIARREADKRGFGRGSGKRVQIVTDGDNDLERYIEELFPEAEHTIDVWHVVEYLWEAGHALYKEGSDELEEWVSTQKEALYEGRVADIIRELDERLALLPKGTRQECLKKARGYLDKRQEKMNYKSLRKQDLEISSGAVEGAVNYVIARRFDSGGMRWIKERAETLLQLRCIEVNDDWDAFISFVHDKTQKQAQQTHKIISLKRQKPAPLPTYGLA
ncbi:MAG: ISKra4 family transposase [Chloroflexi bacterium]|nr:MAG: ISKra4 family transposase [Chloroflexota bacterium]